jgi:hypothetical protein
VFLTLLAGRTGRARTTIVLSSYCLRSFRRSASAAIRRQTSCSILQGMLPTVRRSRSLMIRLGLGLIAIGSLVAVVLLLPDVLNATTSSNAKSYGAVAATVDAAADSSVPPDSAVAEVSVSSSGDEMALAERARDQIASLVSTDDAVDSSALTFSTALTTDTDILPPTLEPIDERRLLAGIDPAAAHWLPLASQITQLARADGMAPAGFGGVMPGGGGAGGWSGGGASGGSASGGASIAAAGGGAGSDAGSAGIDAGVADISGSREAVDVNATPITLGVRHGGSQDERGEQSSNNARSFDNPNGGGANSRGYFGDGPPGVVQPDGGRGGTTSVPEPATLLLMGVGLTALTMSRRRRLKPDTTTLRSKVRPAKQQKVSRGAVHHHDEPVRELRSEW